MKKIIAVLLLVCLCVGLTACKSKEAKNVDNLILAIGDVTLESEDAIIAAREQYEALTDEQKQEIENLSVLTEAQNKLEAKRVDALILAIGDVTLESEDAIIAAREQYEALTDEQKQYVETLSVLTDAQDRLVEVKKENVDLFIQQADSLLRGFEDVEGAYSLLEEAYEYGSADQKELADTLMQGIRNSCFAGTMFIKVENTLSCDQFAVSSGKVSSVDGYSLPWVIGFTDNTSGDQSDYHYNLFSFQRTALSQSPVCAYLDYLFGNYSEKDGVQRTDGDAAYSFVDSMGNTLTVEVSAVDLLDLVGYSVDITIDKP